MPIDIKVALGKCEKCYSAKITKTPVPKQSKNEASEARETTFFDVFGPITPPNVDGLRYFVTFIEGIS